MVSRLARCLLDLLSSEFDKESCHGTKKKKLQINVSIKRESFDVETHVQQISHVVFTPSRLFLTSFKQDKSSTLPSFEAPAELAATLPALSEGCLECFVRCDLVLLNNSDMNGMIGLDEVLLVVEVLVILVAVLLAWRFLEEEEAFALDEFGSCEDAFILLISLLLSVWCEWL